MKTNAQKKAIEESVELAKIMDSTKDYEEIKAACIEYVDGIKGRARLAALCAMVKSLVDRIDESSEYLVAAMAMYSTAKPGGITKAFSDEYYKEHIVNILLDAWKLDEALMKLVEKTLKKNNNV